MEKYFKVYILKFRINNIDRYLADLEGTLSLSKSDSIIFKSREKAYQYAGKLENFYESAGLIASENKTLNQFIISKLIKSYSDISPFSPS